MGVRVVTAALMAGGMLTGCGGDERAPATEPPLPHVEAGWQAQAPSYPTGAGETADQTLRRAKRHFAGRPALRRELIRAEATCRRSDAHALARRFGSAPDPLSLGAGYAAGRTGDAAQVAALGCYLGATRRAAR
jgi:hypothetical protein